MAIVIKKDIYYDNAKRYTGLRPASKTCVSGLLVRKVSDDSIVGILNEANDYAELAWVEENLVIPETLEESFKRRGYKLIDIDENTVKAVKIKECTTATEEVSCEKCNYYRTMKWCGDCIDKSEYMPKRKKVIYENI